MQRGSRPHAVLELADRLHSAAIHLLRRVRREDERTGLGPARLSALSVVVFAGPLRVSALAAAEGVRVPTVTALVGALENAGLVVREPDPSDARAALVRATRAGERVMAEGRARRVAAIARDLAALAPAERTALAAALPLLERLAGPSVHGSGAGAGRIVRRGVSLPRPRAAARDKGRRTV